MMITKILRSLLKEQAFLINRNYHLLQKEWVSFLNLLSPTAFIDIEKDRLRTKKQKNEDKQFLEVQKMGFLDDSQELIRSTPITKTEIAFE